MAGRLEGRVALITGASRGIGQAVAKKFAAEGAQVIITARSAAGLEETYDDIVAVGGKCTAIPLDLQNLADVDKLGPIIADRFGRLDILVGNAGMLGKLMPMTHLPPEMFGETLKVNLTANWHLLRTCDPLLRGSDAGRAIFVTSTVGHEARAFWGAYAISKAGLEMMAKTYADEVKNNTNVKVNLVNPGGTLTAMRKQAYPGENPDALKKPEDTTDLFVQLASPDCEAQGETFTLPKK